MTTNEMNRKNIHQLYNELVFNDLYRPNRKNNMYATIRVHHVRLIDVNSEISIAPTTI